AGMPVSCHGARFLGGNRMLEMTNENFARLLRGLTIAVGHRRNRILLYQFLAAEIRALHCSYGVGDGESYKRALTFLENCERYTLRSLVRRSAKHHAEVTVDHAKRVFSRALKKLDITYTHKGRQICDGPVRHWRCSQPDHESCGQGPHRRVGVDLCVDA